MGTQTETARAWAMQTKERGTSGSLLFEGTMLYSYSTLIAQLVTNEEGARAVLLTSHWYSTTTATQHKAAALSSWATYLHPSAVPLWSVDNVLPRSSSDHESNVRGILARASDEDRRASRARVHTESDGDQLRAEAAAYAAFFGVSNMVQLGPVVMKFS